MLHEVQGSAARQIEGATAEPVEASGKAGVPHFVAEVVARLLKSAASEPVLSEALVLRFMQAVNSTDPEALRSMLPELKRAKVTPAVLADHYIPEVARRLGRNWAEDCSTFAEVSLGTARLQAMLRDIGRDWTADASGATEGATLLLILPEGEQHTLGAMVLAARLRRSGVSVSLRIGESAPTLAAFVRVRSFDGAFISVACHEKLEVCTKLVKTLKDATRGNLKIALGGAVLESGEYCVTGTGADVVTNDVEVALIGLGLMARPEAAALETA